MACTAFANGNQSGTKNTQVVVVAIPLPAQGHLNQLLQFSRLIDSYGIPIHFVSTAAHNRQAKVRAHGMNSPNLTTNIHFHDLQLHYLSSPPSSSPKESTKFPVHLLNVFQASSNLLRQPVSHLIRALSNTYRRVVVIHDSLMASVVQDVDSIPNAESYTYHTSSAFAIFFTIWESMVEKPFELEANIPSKVPISKGWSSPEFEKFLAHQYKFLSRSSGRLYNTCRSLEGEYMDLLAALPISENKKLYAIGPINLLKTGRRHKCLDWLDEQEKDSVIYVSFGTTISMTGEQIRELAIGLERSKQKFIWVLREADKENIFEEDGVRRGCMLPEGYEDRMGKTGIIVRDWVPQPEILAHTATGGFVSHCGWNSCIESISMGVPIATWPMHSDQPKNSVLVTEVLKVGVILKDWECLDDIVKSSDVEKAVRRLMQSNEGKEMRKRAADLGAKVRGSAASGGTSCMEIDSFVAHITR